MTFLGIRQGHDTDKVILKKNSPLAFTCLSSGLADLRAKPARQSREHSPNSSLVVSGLCNQHCTPIAPRRTDFKTVTTRINHARLAVTDLQMAMAAFCN